MDDIENSLTHKTKWEKIWVFIVCVSSLRDALYLRNLSKIINIIMQILRGYFQYL